MPKLTLEIDEGISTYITKAAAKFGVSRAVVVRTALEHFRENNPVTSSSIILLTDPDRGAYVVLQYLEGSQPVLLETGDYTTLPGSLYAELKEKYPDLVKERPKCSSIRETS